jgi:hypothetical protein
VTVSNLPGKAPTPAEIDRAFLERGVLKAFHALFGEFFDHVEARLRTLPTEDLVALDRLLHHLCGKPPTTEGRTP